MDDFSNIQSLKTFVGALDYEMSRNFYDALGWSIGELTADLTEVQLGDFSFFLQRYYKKEWCESSMMFMDVADAAAWRDRIDKVIASADFGEAHAKGPSDQAYALVTHMWDPSGVLWHIAESKR